MSKGAKIGYIIGTALLSALMIFSASMYFFQHENVAGMFESYGFPTWIIYPLAVAKILGLIALWVSKNKTIQHFAYAGFLFNLLLAFGAHAGIGEGPEGWAGAAMGLLFWTLSFLFAKKIEKA